MAEDSEEMFVWGDEFDATLAILEEDEAINSAKTYLESRVVLCKNRREKVLREMTRF